MHMFGNPKKRYNEVHDRRYKSLPNYNLVYKYQKKLNYALFTWFRMSMIRAVIKVPTRGIHVSMASLGPKKKKGGKGGGGGKQVVVKQRPASTVL